MSYIDAECPECSEQFEVYKDDDCDECLILEQQIADLEMIQLSEEQEKKLEEYDRLKAWLINEFGPLEYNLKPSDFILGLDLVVAKLLSDYQYFSQWIDGGFTEQEKLEKRILITQSLFKL